MNRLLSKRGIMRLLTPAAWGIVGVAVYFGINRYVDNQGLRWAGYGLAALMGVSTPIALELARMLGLVGEQG